jgi:hypothetical protein
MGRIALAPCRRTYWWVRTIGPRSRTLTSEGPLSIRLCLLAMSTLTGQSLGWTSRESKNDGRTAQQSKTFLGDLTRCNVSPEADMQVAVATHRTSQQTDAPECQHQKQIRAISQMPNTPAQSRPSKTFNATSQHLSHSHEHQINNILRCSHLIVPPRDHLTIPPHTTALSHIIATNSLIPLQSKENKFKASPRQARQHPTPRSARKAPRQASSTLGRVYARRRDKHPTPDDSSEIRSTGIPPWKP